MRSDGRSSAALRHIRITRKYIKHAEGSVLVEFGDTKVLCTASVEESVPPFLRGKGGGMGNGRVFHAAAGYPYAISSRGGQREVGGKDP